MNGNTGGSNLGSTKIKMSICTIYLYMDHKSSDALLGSRGVYACARISTVRMDPGAKSHGARLLVQYARGRTG